MSPMIQSVVDHLLGRGQCESTGDSGERASWAMEPVHGHVLREAAKRPARFRYSKLEPAPPQLYRVVPLPLNFSDAWFIIRLGPSRGLGASPCGDSIHRYSSASKSMRPSAGNPTARLATETNLYGVSNRGAEVRPRDA